MTNFYQVESVNERTGLRTRLSHGAPMTQEEAIRFRDRFANHPHRRLQLVPVQPVNVEDQADEADTWCHNTPFGWRCTRGAGHEGPCAAVECPEDIALVEGGMKRLRETSSTPNDTERLSWLETHMTDLESRSDGKFALPDFGQLAFRWRRREWSDGKPFIVVPTLRDAIDAAIAATGGPKA